MTRSPPARARTLPVVHTARVLSRFHKTHLVSLSPLMRRSATHTHTHRASGSVPLLPTVVHSRARDEVVSERGELRRCFPFFSSSIFEISQFFDVFLLLWWRKSKKDEKQHVRVSRPEGGAFFFSSRGGA